MFGVNLIVFKIMKKERIIKMNCRNITIEERLRQISTEQPEFAELWSTWNLNKQALEPVLNAIIKDYPHYSFHDATHSESVLLNVERLLGYDNITKLTPTDLWLLLHVAYLHDFGMVIIDNKLYEIWKSTEFQDFLKEKAQSRDEDIKKAAEIILKLYDEYESYDKTWPLDVKKAVTLLISLFCRSKHAEYSKEYIIDVKNLWGIDLGHNCLIKNRLISLIGEISTIHTKPFSEVLGLHKESNGFKNDYVHPRFIACLLRLGDVLDLDNGRFNTFGEEIFGKRPDESRCHYEKHESTKHVLVTSEVIEVEADCNTDAVYRETRKWFDSLENELNNLRLSWNDIAPVEFGRPPKLSSKKILMNGREDTIGLSDLKFTISQKKAFELLEGSSIYKDVFSCLREIIQNAEDASKIQLWRDIKSGMYYCRDGISKESVENHTLLPNDIKPWIYQIYKINVKIEKDEDNNAVVEISDHGTGIAIATLKSMCNVGESYFAKNKQKKEIEEMPEWLKPTANFGVGLQSCFMATSKFSILTNSYDDGTLNIIFESGKEQGYVNVERLSKSIGRGSTVTITFQNKNNFSFDMWGFTAKNLALVEPFKSNCVVIYRIIESIFNECGSSLFDIVVDSQEINFNQTIESCITSENYTEFKNHPSISDCKYRLYDNSEKFTCWYNNTFFSLCFAHSAYHKLHASFKGKSVKHSVSENSHTGFDVTADIYGVSTKDALPLNREKLTKYASQKLEKDLNEVIRIYYDLLYCNVNNIITQANIVDSYFLSCWLYEKDFPEELKQYLSTEKKFNVLQLINNEYVKQQVSLKDLSDSYPHLYYLMNETSEKRMFSDETYSFDMLLEIINNHKDKINGDYIVIDDNLKQYLKVAYCDKIFFDGTELEKGEVCICKINITNDLYSPDQYTKEVLLKKLVHDTLNQKYRASIYNMRFAIPAFKEYENLATKIYNLLFIGVEHYAKWYIISPISKLDYPKIFEMTEDMFVQYIISQETFNNIIEHILKHRRNKQTTREDIIENYKKIIREYYNIAIKEQLV